MKALADYVPLCNGNEVWLGPNEYDQLVELIPEGARFMSPRHEGENIIFPLTAPQTTVFRRQWSV